MTLSKYIPICDAIVKLMTPLVEVVIHDAVQNRIAYINGTLSSRVVGDASLLDLDGLDALEEVVYPKLNFDGRLVKSISVAIEGNYILCINCDVSIFNKMQEISSAILKMDAQPSALFGSDWQEKLHISIHTYLQNHNLSFEHLSLSEKKALTKHLFDLGAFQEKNAAEYIAKILRLGRATVFKYLKEWRGK